MSNYVMPEEPHHIAKLGDRVKWNIERNRCEWATEEEIENMKKEAAPYAFIPTYNCPACNLFVETVLQLQQRVEKLEEILL